LNEIDHGNLQVWKTMPAPEIAIKYWKMPADATVRDVIAIIRADECMSFSLFLFCFVFLID
jgi:ubiquinol oxidase